MVQVMFRSLGFTSSKNPTGGRTDAGVPQGGCENSNCSHPRGRLNLGVQIIHHVVFLPVVHAKSHPGGTSPNFDF